MSLLCEKGTFTVSTVAVNPQTVTLSNGSLTPKVLFLWCTSQTATGFNQDIDFHFGASTGSAQDFSDGYSSDDNQASTNTGGRRASTRVLHTSSNGSGTSDVEIDTVSFAAGSFNLNIVANATASAYIIHYFVMGGTDLTNVRAGETILNTVTGNQSTTTPGFQPDAVFFFTSSNVSTSFTNSAMAMGWAKSSSDRYYSNYVSDDANNAGGNTGNLQVSTRCIGSLTASSPGTLAWDADFVSMDANGFTWNITDAPGAANVLHWVAFKFTSNGMVDIGTETHATTNTTRSTTGLSVVPKAAMFFGGARASSASIDTGATSGRWFTGVSDGTNEGCSSTHDTDGADPSQVAQHLSTTQSIVTMTADTTLTGTADVTFPGGGQFDAAWTNTDGTAREFIYAVFGDTLAGVTTRIKDPVGAGVVVKKR